MVAYNWIYVLMLVVCFTLSEVSTRPTENENILYNSGYDENKTNMPRFFPNDQTEEIEIDSDETKNILDKIKQVNERLRRPDKRQLNNNNPESFHSGFGLDKETLEKLQQLISFGNYQTLQHNDIQQEYNSMNSNLQPFRQAYSRALLKSSYKQLTSPMMNLQQMLYPSYAVMNVPILVMPSANIGEYDSLNNEINDISSAFSGKQRPPQLPFQIQWPFAQYFPILIKDPFIGLLHGGGWHNFIEYGQLADVCNRKQKSTDNESNNAIDNEVSSDIPNDSLSMYSSRQGRALKKRTVSHDSAAQKLLTDTTKSSRKIFGNRNKLVPTKKPIQQIYDEDDNDPIDEANGDLRVPFGQFGMFGDKKPLIPSPGFFINRLKVRKGGVAIAGPGGVATAGRGGTAIVGPGGLAYTQPGGLAVAGPKAKVYALSPDVDLSSLISRIQAQAVKNNGTVNTLTNDSEGRLVATGPVVYYHELDQS